jgi:hypothetical protein
LGRSEISNAVLIQSGHDKGDASIALLARCCVPLGSHFFDLLIWHL